ncbi:AlpA family phage regulatory protein [Paraferrimonas sp. SM1919]|uniref:AlpA family phage regulatory protein n=1 Tax=Paraferrimonas sp. SM1919 TaxID=2662263 RepID=UPI0013D1922A|nr:AlpA family phage regulatory protein [Paraferrimonas sp. SM1919]
MIVRDKKREEITGISRRHALELEKKDQFPKRRKLSARAVGWVESELLDWVASRETVGYEG